MFNLFSSKSHEVCVSGAPLWTTLASQPNLQVEVGCHVDAMSQ